MRYFPIFLDLEKFKVLVVGGGNVATRKVENLLEFNTYPTIISPLVTDELKELIDEHKLNYFQRKYQKGDSRGFSLVFVATDDPEVDTLILEDCYGTNALVNFSDKPDICNFIMPSFIRRDDLVIAISTQGKAPFLSKYIRECLEKRFPTDYGNFVQLAKLLRTKIMELGIQNPNKEALLEEFLSINWLEIIRDDGYDFAILLITNLLNHYANKK
jgi:precorrin-2 dehydrogenase/sirohydrochlorin ferrochelatase